MALVNPAGLYHQDIYSMNFQPYVNSILQARAKKAAREDAMDKYYRELPSKINDAGVRDADRPYIEELRNNMYSFGLQNKDRLRKGDGASQLGMEKHFRELESAINRSKGAAKSDLTVGQAILKKENGWMPDDDEFMEANRRHSLSINDPEFQEYNMPKLLSNKPIVINEEAKNLQTKFKYGSVEGGRKLDPSDPNYNVVTFVPQLDKETKDQLYNYSAQDVHNRPRLKKLIDSKVNNPIELSKLNDVSLKVFGHPIREDFKIEDGAAAFNASILPVNEPTREKVQVDVGAARKNAKDMQEDRQAHQIVQQARGYQYALKRQANAARLGLGSNTPPNLLDEFTTTYGETAINPVTKENVLYVNVKNIPSKYRSLLGTAPAEIGDEQVYIVNEDGTYTGADGQIVTPVATSDAYSKVFGTSKFKLEGREAFVNRNKGNKPTPQPKEESFSREDYKAAGWTDKQINEALKAGKIKIN